MSFRLAVAIAFVCTSTACLKPPPFRGIGADGGPGDGGGDGDATPGGPLWAYLKARDPGAADHFGTSIAISSDGKTLAVGAPDEDGSTQLIDGPVNDLAMDAGAVNVFVAGVNGWTQEAYVKAPDGVASDKFGSAVALSADGNTLAVGAPYEATLGLVYVYVRNGNAWTYQNSLQPGAGYSAGDKFGSSVALSSAGNTLIVGAPGEDGDAMGVGGVVNEMKSDSGAAYVFTRVVATWNTSAVYVKASDTTSNDAFGTSVAISGDGMTIAVGAPRVIGNGGGTNGTGAVYAYRELLGTWTFDSKVAPAIDYMNLSFGDAIALSALGTVLAVGATGDSSDAKGVNVSDAQGTATRSGAVFVFDRNGTWLRTAYMKASNADGLDTFGSSVALARDGLSILVGAPKEASAAIGIGGNEADNSASFAGAAYLFQKTAQWQQTAYVKASNTEPDDTFGASVALADMESIFAVGASAEDSAGTQTDNTAAGAGAVYVFRDRP